MAIHLLAPRQVQTAGVGVQADGDGLFLSVTDRGSSWVFRFTAPSGKRREMGLGAAIRDTLAAAGESLANARKQANAARALLHQQPAVDPIEHRNAERQAAQAKEAAKKAAAVAKRLTLARAARGYHERVIEPRLSALHASHWISSLENHMPAEIWHAPVASITAPQLLAALSTVRRLDSEKEHVPETLRRIRQRLSAVFEDLVFHGHCVTNPAEAVRRKVRETLPAKKEGHYAALDWREVPAFAKRLRELKGTSARALEFAMLTAARTGEVLGATWAELSLQQRTWRIPGERMKAGEDHIVYLSDRAVEILQQMQEIGGKPFVFPSPMDESKPLSNMAMLTLLRRMKLEDRTTVHGVCRSSFSTWANEAGVARDDAIEACLAHKEQDRVKAAYNRAQFAVERQRLLQAWTDYCAGKALAQVTPPSAEVIPLPRAA